jgi:hypothetical protein
VIAAGNVEAALSAWPCRVESVTLLAVLAVAVITGPVISTL